MSKEMEFFIFLIEAYAEYKNTTADRVIDLWDSIKVEDGNTLTNYIKKMYFRYHTERIENAFEDIDNIIETGKRKWY